MGKIHEHTDIQSMRARHALPLARLHVYDSVQRARSSQLPLDHSFLPLTLELPLTFELPPQRKNLVQDLDQDHAQDQDGKIIAAKFLVS